MLSSVQVVWAVQLASFSICASARDRGPVPPAHWLLRTGLASPQTVFNGFENYRFP